MSVSPVTPARASCCGKEQITSLSTVKGLTPLSNARWVQG